MVILGIICSWTKYQSFLSEDPRLRYRGSCIENQRVPCWDWGIWSGLRRGCRSFWVVLEEWIIGLIGLLHELCCRVFQGYLSFIKLSQELSLMAILQFLEPAAPKLPKHQDMYLLAILRSTPMLLLNPVLLPIKSQVRPTCSLLSLNCWRGDPSK